MKHYLAIILGALFCLSALPTTAEARHYDQDRYDHDRYERHERSHRDHYSYRSYRRHHRESHRVWRGAHYSRYHGHRVFVPGRFVILFH